MNAYLVIIFIGWFMLPQTPSYTSQSSSLPQTTSAEANAHFNQGLLLLHNFEYVDAAEEFVLAQEKDPDMVMAYWGEAMTYDHPIWRDLDIEKSRAAMKKLGANSTDRMAKGKTPLEKDYLQGIEILFGEGSKPDREKAYADHMAKMYEKYPANHDVAAFYALSLLAIKQGWYVWESYNEKAAEITNKILREDPNHPGALHYLVHADDHPRYAQNGLDAANRYGKVASYAGHALHMPSHIYLALGMWDDVVTANEISWQAGVDRMERKKLDNDQLNYHAHLWLAYGYLQQGRFDRAKKLLDNQIKYTEALSSTRARYHLLEMTGHYLVNTNNWNDDVALLDFNKADLDISAQFTAAFIEGYKHFQSGELVQLDRVVENLNKEVAKASMLQQEKGEVTVCGATRYANSLPTEKDIKTGTRFLNLLKALQSWKQKDLKTAESYFKDALPKEGSVVVGPPVFLLSPYEAYGHFLLSNNRAAEAMQQFDKALAASPRRLIALKGKFAAAKALQDRPLASKIKTEMKQILKHADASVIAQLEQ